jgi:surface polysaccharide O-acyltransferase-like enzyme
VLVVFVHSYNIDVRINNGLSYSISGFIVFLEEFFSNGLNRIASPLFFIISGYLFFANISGRYEDFLLKLKKRFRTLVIPYLLWSLAGLALYSLLQMLPLAGVFFTKTHISDMSIRELLYSLVLDPVPYQLWFIRDLFMFVLLSPILYYLIKNLRFVLLIICFILWIADIYFILFRSQSLLFYTIGSLVAIHYKDKAVRQYNINYGPIVVVWVAVITVKTFLGYDLSGNVVLTGLLHKGGIILGILAVNSVYDRFSDKIRSFYEKNKPVFSFTFFVYASHEPILTIIKKSLFYFTGFSTFSFFMIYIISPLLTLSICLATATFMKSKLPVVYRHITGGR